MGTKPHTDKKMPWEVEKLLICAKFNFPMGTKTFDEAKAAGPEYFNKLGEFDPYFTSRSWWHYLIGYAKRFWIVQVKLRIWKYQFIHSKTVKCPQCKKKVERGIMNMVNHSMYDCYGPRR